MSVAVSVAVSRSAHHHAMIRLRSTLRDRPTSVSSRAPRQPATIEAARADHSLGDVVRRADTNLCQHFRIGHGSLPAALPWPLRPLPLFATASRRRRLALLRLRPDGDVVKRVCQSEGGGWRQAIRILDAGCALDARGPCPNRRPSIRTFLPAGGLRQLRCAPARRQASRAGGAEPTDRPPRRRNGGPDRTDWGGRQAERA